MLAGVESPRHARRSDSLLIMRVITSVGLALLLVLGLAMTHSDASTAHTSTGSVVAGEAAVTASVDPAVASAAEAGIVFGITACIFGILCGLALVAVLRRRHRRPAAVLLDRGERAAPVLALAPVDLRPTALSLTQLSLSRT